MNFEGSGIVGCYFKGFLLATPSSYSGCVVSEGFLLCVGTLASSDGIN